MEIAKRTQEIKIAEMVVRELLLANEVQKPYTAKRHLMIAIELATKWEKLNIIDC